MKTTVSLLALALLHGVVTAQTPAKTLTLDEAVQLARQNSKPLKTNAADQGAALARVQQARDRYMPSVTANLSYVRISDNIRPFTVSLPDVGPVQLNPQILNQSYNNLAVRQTIWAGGQVKLGIRVAEQEAQALKLEAGQYQLLAADNVTEIWQNLYLLETSERLIRQNIRLLTDRRREIANLERQGIILKNDGLKIDLAISNLEANLVDIEAGRSINTFNLATAIGYGDTPFAIDTTGFTFPQSVAPLGDYLQEALANRTEVKALGMRREAAVIGQRIVVANRLPTLSLAGSYDYNRPNQRVFPNKPEFTGTWQVGALLSFNIAGLYTNRAKETESRYGIERLNTALDQAREGIQMEVNAAYQTYVKARQQVRLAQTAIGQATENFRIEQNRLQAGATTPTDFLEANTQQLQAQLNLRSANARTWLALWQLQKSTGLTN
ncbi:TolC family protein [Spirosoma arcticum]